MSITTVDFLVEALIKAKHGWAVSEQFLGTFNSEPFEEQNFNALQYIREEVESILRSKLLSEDAQDELQTYRDDLEDYMVEAE